MNKLHGVVFLQDRVVPGVLMEDVARPVDLVSRFAGEIVQETAFIWLNRKQYATSTCVQDSVSKSCLVQIPEKTSEGEIMKQMSVSLIHMYVNIPSYQRFHLRSSSLYFLDLGISHPQGLVKTVNHIVPQWRLPDSAGREHSDLLFNRLSLYGINARRAVADVTVRCCFNKFPP